MICLRSKRSCLFWNEVKEKAKEKHKTHVNFNDTFHQDSQFKQKIFTLGLRRRRHLAHQAAHRGCSAPSHPPLSVADFTCQTLATTVKANTGSSASRTASFVGAPGKHCRVVLSLMYTAPCRCKTVRLSSLFGQDLRNFQPIEPTHKFSGHAK